MNTETRECFSTAADMLRQATGCQPSQAAQIVNLIALGTIRWMTAESQTNVEDPKPPTSTPHTKTHFGD